MRLSTDFGFAAPVHGRCECGAGRVVPENPLCAADFVYDAYLGNPPGRVAPHAVRPTFT